MMKLTSLFAGLLVLCSCNTTIGGNNPSQSTTTDNQQPHSSSESNTPAQQEAMTNYFPFELNEVDGQFLIVASLESDELYPKYYDFFKKHGYEGNGYCWQGHITQILEKLDGGLLRHIQFDPEAGAFFAYADSRESQLKFAELLSPIFSDLNKLEEWVSKADRSRVDD